MSHEVIEKFISFSDWHESSELASSSTGIEQALVTFSYCSLVAKVETTEDAPVLHAISGFG